MTKSARRENHGILPRDNFGRGWISSRRRRAASKTTEISSTAHDHPHAAPRTEVIKDSSGEFRIPAIPRRMLLLRVPLKNAPKKTTTITSSDAANKTQPNARRK